MNSASTKPKPKPKPTEPNRNAIAQLVTRLHDDVHAGFNRIASEVCHGKR